MEKPPTSDTLPPPEVIARLDGMLAKHEAQRAKLQRMMRDLQQLIMAAEKRVRVLGAENKERRYLTLQTKLLRAQIAHLGIYDIELQDIAANLNRLELVTDLAGHAVAYADVQVKLMECEELHTIFKKDLEKARAGKPSTGRLPQAWIDMRPTLATTPATVEVLQKFMTDFEIFRAAIPAALDAYNALAPELSERDRLKALKVVNIPALLGLHYRLEALLKPLPQGPELLQTIRNKMPSLSNTAELPAEVKESKGRKVTERLSTLFKGKDAK